MENRRLKGIYLLHGSSCDLIYGAQEKADISRLVEIVAAPQTSESIVANPELLAGVEVIFSGWGAPKMDEAFLAAAPLLQAVFYGAGSIRNFTTEAFWERKIVVTSSYAANALPVAEYAMSVILLSLKHFWKYSAAAKQNRGHGDHTRPVIGAFRSTVGFVSSGMIARRTLELLRPFDLQRLIACPFLQPTEAEALQAELVPLSEIFEKSDVVSLHTPEIPATLGMITGKHFGSMKPGATFLNTARGGVVREAEMIEILQQRPDLTAVLDVTLPEPPAADSPLLTLPNVVLTPHIAGSMGAEIQRLGRYMVEELQRYLAGEPLRWQITREAAARMA